MENYQALLQEIETCQACPLCQARTNVVPGDGNLQAKIMFIGEGPGAEEDKRGIPFVGAAGQLLDQMLDTIGLRREDVYIANIVKCRPPANRVPKPDEVAACMGYLERQIEIVDPKIIVLLGATALNHWFSKSRVDRSWLRSTRQPCCEMQRRSRIRLRIFCRLSKNYWKYERNVTIL